MKLIRCKNCDDVVRLIHTKWRKCECGESGGQYNGTTLTATVGGDCEVIGIRNDFFDHPKFSAERLPLATVIEGEYKGDTQILRIDSSDGPALEMTTTKVGDLCEITVTDKRNFHINLLPYDCPLVFSVPWSDTPSFKAHKVKQACA